MSLIVVFCSKGDTLGVRYFEPMRLGYQARPKLNTSVVLYVFSIEVYVITDPYHTAVCTYKATNPSRYKDYGI
jgi:hypothetical protein